MVSWRSFFCIFFVYLGVLRSISTVYVGPVPDALEQRVVSLIDGAHSRIWVALFRLSSAPCVHALVRAKERNVDVRVILDSGVLGLPVHAVMQRQLRRAGIAPWWSGRRSLMHHKWAIIDNKVFMGSANWTHAGLNNNHEICAFFDDPSIVQGYATHFITLTRRIAGFAARSPLIGRSFFFIPDHRREARSRLDFLLEGARRRIWISMYAFTSIWCWKKLADAVQRGVSVKVVLEPSEIFPCMQRDKAVKVGVHVRRYKSSNGAILHDKCALIDDTVVFGSMNWTGAGMRLNEESVMLTDDRVIGEKVGHCFTQLFDGL
ncbi:MAG: hypothetical protein QG604_412 [Candidatus Dependentiae bacterium]|nr:hypothetical protein [Candidatus Dependentiae bacterium]